MEPPRIIPESMRDAFTLGGTIPVYNWYLKDTVAPASIKWTNSYLQSFIDRFTFENITTKKHGKESYIDGSLFHVQAFTKYSLRGKNVAVIGSQSPWIEAILVNAGAKTVTTVEYNVPICDHSIIKTKSYDEFCKSDDKYDAIITYSSIEHTGLGRYGDPLNPNGDIETMEHIHRCLNDEGLCFLGVPVGKDYLVWNAHRIYGTKRLNLLYLNKFKELDWIGCNKSYIDTAPTPRGNPDYIQPIIVLQK
jgi:hypothetical protein